MGCPEINSQIRYCIQIIVTESVSGANKLRQQVRAGRKLLYLEIECFEKKKKKKITANTLLNGDMLNLFPVLSKTSQVYPLLWFQLSIILIVLIQSNKAKEIVKDVRIVIIWKDEKLSLSADNTVIEKSKLLELLKEFSKVAGWKSIYILKIHYKGSTRGGKKKVTMMVYVKGTQ